jgi:preprotein translocase subunit SecA
MALMALAVWNKLFGDTTSRELVRIQPLVAKINALESTFRELSDEGLKGKTGEFKDRLAKGESLDSLLPEAFAAVREASTRTLNQRHFDVQLLGGIVLHEGRIAEMRTGEGKTLVATLPAYLNALAGKGVHVVTVNDYLSRRDAVWMGQIYNFLGLSVAVINHESSFVYDPSIIVDKNLREEDDKTVDEKGSFKIVDELLRPVTRREAYEADITYGTNSQFGFDYLRDNLEYEEKSLRQSMHAFAIVDEIDSILIDEARTPLIISAPTSESEDLYRVFAGIAKRLKRDDHYEVDEKMRAITLTPGGIDEAEKILGIDNMYSDTGVKLVHHLETAVKAEALYRNDKEYVVKDGQVVIVDEFTGRLQPGRRWSEGLHQAIEAKEGVEVQKESRTYASITYQNYFRMYEKLSGMTGTAETSAEEFYKVYGLSTVVIPTNKTVARIDRDDYIFQTENGKFKAIAKKVKELYNAGQPVLIGTASIEKNELLSQYLIQEGVKHEVLNAKNHQREGEIVAQAGRKSAVTIATNMAGRGVDIKLGGNPGSEKEYEDVKTLGGLFVLGTERHEARRIDNQLRGRSGRQGDPGETQFYVSLEDNLMRVFASDSIKKMMGRFGIPEDEPIQNRMVTNALEKAQERIEGFHFDARKHVLQYDDVMNFQRKVVYERRRKLLLAEKETLREELNEVLAKAEDEVADSIKKRQEELGEDNFLSSFRLVALQSIDMFWVEHLEMMDYLRSSVNLRAYGQRDPLVEYKKEGLQLFKKMEYSIDGQIISILPKVGSTNSSSADLKTVQVNAQIISKGDGSKNTAGEPGRNDPCPCGSGKKWKKCGAIDSQEHKDFLAKVI